MKKIFSITLVLLLAALSYSVRPFFLAQDHRLVVHYIDVGQGDATLILTPGGKSMLIDAGNNNQGDTVLSYLRSVGVKQIDVLIGTHPDADHVGGMDIIIDNFPIRNFYMPMKYHQTKTFDDVLRAAKKNHLPVQEAARGQKLFLDETVQTTFLSPFPNKYYEDNNAYSAVVKLTYKGTSFLFMGDADTQNEADMIAAGDDLDVDILKLGHHGSSTSTSDIFLEKTSPSAVIASCGYRNKYSHPHREVLERLEQKKIPLYRTDEQGDLVIRSDGKTITVNQSQGSYTYRKP